MSLSAATPYTIDANGSGAVAVAKISSTAAIALYRDTVATDMEARVVNLNETVNAATTIEGTPLTGFSTADVAVLSSTQAVYACPTSTGTTFRVGIITISGTTLTLVGASIVNPTGFFDTTVAVRLLALSSTSFLLVGDNSQGDAIYFTVSGNTITEESTVTYEAGAVTSNSLAALSATKALVAYADGGDTDILKMCVLSISGTTVSAGTPVNVEASDTGAGVAEETALAPIDSSKVLLAYANTTDTATEAVVISVSGTVPSANTPATVVGSVAGFLSLAAFSTSEFILIYNAQMAQINVSGTTVIVGTPSAYTTDVPTSNKIVTFSSTAAIAVYAASAKAVTITFASFSGYDLIVSAGGNAKSSIAVAADGESIFFALEEDVSGNQVILKATRPASPTVSIAYAPGAGSAGNVFATGDRDTVIFGGNFATDVGVINHAVDAGTNTDISPSSIGADIISPIVIDPTDATHIVAINKTDEDALETTNGGTSWATLTATLGIQVVGLAVAFFGKFFPFGAIYGGNDGVDENVRYTPNEFSSTREDTVAALQAAGNITGIDLSLDID